MLGQIKSIEDLQQELKDLLNKQELKDANVHGETKRTEELKDSYKPEEEISTVLDPKAIDDKLLDRLPTPTGYRMLILPYAGPKKTKGGILLSDTTQETIQMTTVCGLVLKMGNLCYRDKEKFPLDHGAINDWVIFQ